MLVGGTDTSLPVLSPGSQIPEMSLAEFQKTKALNFWSWFSSEKMSGTMFVLIVLLIIAVVLIAATVCAQYFGAMPGHRADEQIVGALTLL